MSNIKQLYHQLFVQHVVEEYSPLLKDAKSGHCMKITGFAMRELKVLLPKLRSLNNNMDTYILSNDESGEEYIHDTKLIELRNNPKRCVLVLIPSDSRTSSEDSYGDATFQNLSVSELQQSFFEKLIEDIPNEKFIYWKNINNIAKEMNVSLQTWINYLIYIEINNYTDEAWGNGIYLIGMLPDSDLIKSESSIRSRFMFNQTKVSSVLGDFSLTAPDRISKLPLQRDTIQKDLMKFLSSEGNVEDSITLFEKIHDNHPEFNYASMPWINKDFNQKIKIYVDLVPGKDSHKELVKDPNTGDYILSIILNGKGKVSFTIKTEPSPQDNPDIFSFEVALIRLDDFEEVGIVKKAKVGINKNAKRKLSINIVNGMFDDGEYLLRARALDENGIILDMEDVFKEESVQNSWEEAKKADSSLQMEQYRLENHVAYSNESDVFTINNNSEEAIEGEGVNKRTKVNSLTQAIINYHISHLTKKGLFNPYVEITKNKWISKSLNSIYQFDFGASYAYQIQMSNKLMQLERAFLENRKDFGFVEARLSGNPTDTKILNPNDTALEKPHFIPLQGVKIPEELISCRKNLFTLISESVSDGSGLTCTLDFTTNTEYIKTYLFEYELWIRNLLEQELEMEAIVAIQNLDTINLEVEMPDGTIRQMKLITPLHPLRLAWMTNLYELYQDWEDKTLEHEKYKKSWFRKLDKLFQGQIPMDIAPLVLSDNSLKEAYQYIGELTFGWGAYVQPDNLQGDDFASSYRQLKSYTSMLLNVEHEKRIDSDVSLNLVIRHLMNYSLSHPYTDKLIINLFNAGDAAIFTQALVELEKRNLGRDLTYEIRLFSNDNKLQSGEAFKDLISPDGAIALEAEVFSQASVNRLFPKLRFSINNISNFINNHNEYPAHLSFLVNPFSVRTELIHPNSLSRSFYLNGTICRNVVSSEKEGASFIWNRYFSNKTIAEPISEFANLEVSIFSRIQEITSMLLSSTRKESIPATTLRLKENDMMMLSFIHDISDWVITFDKNMGPEFYDLPYSEDGNVPYLLDYVPGEETTGLSSFLTTRPTSEIEALMIPLFKEYGIDLEKHDNFSKILRDVRTVSSSLIMQVNETSRKGFEVLGTTLTKRFLEKKGIMKESFLIPIDLHKELFVEADNDNKERADNLVVKIDTTNKELLFTVVEIKCRNAQYNVEELHKKIVNQIENTIYVLRSHYEIAEDGYDRLDRELKILELKELLEFYIRRSLRYECLNPEIANSYLQFLGKLSEGYSIRFKELGVIYDFMQKERQKKEFCDDATIYTMGQPVIEEILKEKGYLDTKVLNAMDDEFINFFEPTTLNGYSESYLKNEDSTDSESLLISDVSYPKQVKTAEKPKLENSIQEKINPKKNNSEEEVNNENISSIDNLSKNEESNMVQVNDSNYKVPTYDMMIGASGESQQFGILGKTSKNNRIIGLDLNECCTMSLFGVQGSGKSYTIGTITEMVLKQFSNVNKLPAPMAGVIFHYSDSMDYAPEFTSMIYPNDEDGQLARLKNEYGVSPNSINDVVLLAPESQVLKRKEEYPDLEVNTIGFDSSELTVKDWTFLLGAMGNDSTYIHELKQIMKACRDNMSLQNLRKGVDENEHMSNSQRKLAEQRLDFAKEYITDGHKLQQHLKPGRLIIVDLRDEFIEKDEALGLFVVMLNIFSSVLNVDGKAFNKFIVFDEAHKYMSNKELVSSITTVIREMRHKGVSIMIASQDPMSLPIEIIELSSIVVMHRFSSPGWVKHIQKAITALQTLTAREMASLGSGEAYIWANKATDKIITQRALKANIRPRVTKHGGETKQAVNHENI